MTSAPGPAREQKGLPVSAYTADVDAIAKALYAARLLAEGCGKLATAANMRLASDALARLAACAERGETLEAENERLREILGDAVPALGHHARDFSQRALIEACKITGGDPYEFTYHPDALTRLLAAGAAPEPEQADA